MILTFDYNRGYDPAMPMLEVTLKNQVNDRGINLVAIVDSGADATMILRQYLETIQARISDQRMMRGVVGNATPVLIYSVWLEVGSVLQKRLDVVGTQLPEAIIGRDVLNDLVTTLDGLSQTVQIQM